MKKIIFLFLITLLFFLNSSHFFAQAQSDPVADKQKEIDELEKKVNELLSQEKTLSSQLSFMNSQIKLTTLKINQTQDEIVNLTGKISRLEVSLDYLAEILNKRIAATYKQGKIEPLTILLSSNKFSDLISRYKYLKIAQLNDKKLILAMEETRTNYDEQKTEVQALKVKLETQKKSLDQQKKDKESLLTVTKNDEKKYQQLLAQAYAEKAAIEQALVAGTKVGPVKKGDAIALVGNSGYPSCSTGKHLHFEIRRNNTWTDPAPFLEGKTVEDNQNNSGNINMGSGSWSWPISEPIRITQFYGHTPYSWRYTYSGGVHTGIDMVPSNSDVIKAPADGTLYKSSQLCGSSTINIVYIDHGDSLISFYLHVQ